MSGPEPALKDFIKLCEDPDALEQLKKDAPTEWCAVAAYLRKRGTR
jgi:hypothetical protein